MEVYSFSANDTSKQTRTQIGRSAPLKHVPYTHSFGVTPNYVVLALDLDLCMTPACLSRARKGMLNLMGGAWQGMHVIDLEGKTTVFDTEPFFNAHTVNTFENATGITMDVGAFKAPPFGMHANLDISLFLNKTSRDTNPVRGSVRRLHMHLTGPMKGAVTFEDFVQRPGSMLDFFRINPAYNGLPYCFYWAVEWWHDGQSYASMAILKHDVCTGTKTYWRQENVYVAEPVFVPRPAGEEEDDGIIMVVVLDGQKGKSKLVMLNAKTMTELNGTTAELPTHIPFTAHGQFFPQVTATLPTMV